MKYFYVLFLTAIIACAGCGIKELPEQPQIKAKLPAMRATADPAVKDMPRYTYAGTRNRDPFQPLPLDGTSTRIVGDVVVPPVGSLILKGIMADGKQKMAIISAGGIGYVLKGKYLYDNRQRLIHGITGIIKEESVIIIAPDKTTKEIRLREK